MMDQALPKDIHFRFLILNSFFFCLIGLEGEGDKKNQKIKKNQKSEKRELF